MTLQRVSATVFVGCLAVAGIVLWSMSRHENADSAPVDVTVPNPDDSLASQASTLRTEAASPTPPSEPLDLAYHCAALSGLLDSADPSVGGPEAQDVSDDCKTALDRQFLDASVSNTILPASSSPSWRQVFGGFPAKVGIVKAALANENCDVPDGEIRPHLASDCGGRAPWPRSPCSRESAGSRALSNGSSPGQVCREACRATTSTATTFPGSYRGTCGCPWTH